MLVTLGCGVPAAHASLGVPTGGSAITFSGAGPSTASAQASFEAAIGGADNGTTAGEQASGFRHVNWDDVALNGSDPGSTALPGGHTVALGGGRLHPWGLDLGPDVAVADDGFHSVNPNAQFTPFSAPNVWAPFNSTAAELDVVAPDGQGSTPVPAQTRGIGVVLLNVMAAGTSIQLFNGDIPLLSQPAPAPTGATSFVGVLFPAAVVTRAVITLGTGEVFDFNGSTASHGPSTDLVAGDDVTLAEPAPARGALTATAGIPVSAALDTFTESNPNAIPTAQIDWGDGTRTTGTISPGSGGTFVVTGSHAYAQTGSYTATVTVDDLGGPEQTRQTGIRVGTRTTTTNLACSPTSVAVSASTTCTATVTDAAGGSATPPAGVIAFSSPTPGAAFAQNGACLLGPTAVTGVSSCTVLFTPGQLPPRQARVAIAYAGDGAHTGGNATATVTVHAQRCTLKALTRRLRAPGLGVLVTCDARSGVQIGVKAAVGRHGRLRAFQLQFGTVRSSVAAGRPTVLLVKPSAGVLPTLRAALRRHQRVSLRLTLTASSHATTKTTTTRVSALRAS